MKLAMRKINLDRIGITASTLCAIHCAALPFVLTMLPLWGLEFLANEAVEIGMIVLSLLLGIWSLGRAYRKDHQKILPVFLLVIGFSFIGFGHFLGIDSLEPILIPLGGVIIAAAHFVNLKLLNTCVIKHKH
ncbi:MerC domain-containing protein [Pedobacter sp. AW1-32]|uniref:MerC domain-containing protein n=1 Tax=Pedobacter sp. AW1-32 TaxID=3383026 RepID=UPI003FEDCA7D